MSFFSLLYVILGTSFVSILATCFLVLTHLTCIFLTPILSLMYRNLTSTCFVPLWSIRFAIKQMVGRLLHKILVCSFYFNPILFNSLLSQTPSLLALLVAINSNSVVDWAILGFFIEYHAIAPHPSIKTYLVFDFQSLILFAYSISQNPFKIRFSLSPWYIIP